MQGSLKRISGPAFMGSSVADIYTPPASTILTQINQIHIANVTGGPVTYTLYLGGTGGSTAGTELAKGISIPANGIADLYFSPGLKMSSTDFLSGLASAGSSLTITVMGKQSCVES